MRRRLSDIKKRRGYRARGDPKRCLALLVELGWASIVENEDTGEETDEEDK